jgi:hypothetical protein
MIQGRKNFPAFFFSPGFPSEYFQISFQFGGDKVYSSRFRIGKLENEFQLLTQTEHSAATFAFQTGLFLIKLVKIIAE